MTPINIADLKPGMVLTKAVRNPQGVLLLDAGTKITKKNIRIFKSWGVIEIFIKGDSNPPENSNENLAEGIEDTIEFELKAKFADVMDDPVMVEIFKAARNQMTKNLSSSEREK
jgi:hypothetical protein